MGKLSSEEIAHLGMIQGVINRMASNSLALKTLGVTIASAVIALSIGKDDASAFIPAIGLLPIIVFWVLDAKYLRLEKLYRKLYDHVRIGKETEPFSMKVSAFNEDVSSAIRLAFSWSVWWCYASVAIVLIVVIFLLRCNGGA